MSYYYRPSLMTVSALSYQSGAPLVLSDHGRSPIEIGTERIEYRERMLSGRMRSKFIADKNTFSVDWEMLPSRSVVGGTNVVADGYASANDLAEFYAAVTGEFNLTLYSDTGLGATISPTNVFGSYQVFFSNFSMEIVKRGKDFDFYNVSMEMEQA